MEPFLFHSGWHTCSFSFIGRFKFVFPLHVCLYFVVPWYLWAFAYKWKLQMLYFRLKLVAIINRLQLRVFRPLHSPWALRESIDPLQLINLFCCKSDTWTVITFRGWDNKMVCNCCGLTKSLMTDAVKCQVCNLCITRENFRGTKLFVIIYQNTCFLISIATF